MAKLSTPRLQDVAPNPAELAAVVDRLTDVGLLGSPLAGVRITVHNEQGALSAALVLTVANGKWADCTIAVNGDADAAVVSRINRLMRGFAPKSPNAVTVTPSRSAAPIFETYWRTKAMSARHSGKRYDLPVVAEGKPHIFTSGGSNNVMLRWSIANHRLGLNLPTNAALGYVPVQVATSPRPRRTSRSTVAPRQSSVSAPTPVIQPTVAPKGATISPQTAIPTPAPRKAPSLPAGHPGIFRELPTKAAFPVHVKPEAERKLSVALAGFEAGRITVVGLRGPSGTGKTLLAEHFAAQNGLPFWKVDVMALRDFSDWTGSVTLTESPSGVVTRFTPSQFAEAIASDGPYGGIPRLVLLDELPRAETSSAQNALIPCLDGRGTIYVPDARRSISIDPAVFWMFTANIGAGFTGNVVTDVALINRANGWIDVGYPDAATEATILVEQGKIAKGDASKLVQVAKQVRDMAARGEIEDSISTRQLVATAAHMAYGLNPVEACEFGFVTRFSPEGDATSDRTKVQNIVNAVLR